MKAYEPLHPHLKTASLVFFSQAAIARGIGYLQKPSTGGLTTFVDGLIPLRAWAVIWILGGISMLIGIKYRAIARLSLSLGASLWGVWAISYFLATLTGSSSRGWMTGSLILGLAGAMAISAALIDTEGLPKNWRVIPVTPELEESLREGKGSE